uniref:Post-GPI attachment to proteins factor 2 n=1 Tax=Mesocestoides corti TaxID=53468 RepID=A0A5K3F4C4_MESCO
MLCVLLSFILFFSRGLQFSLIMGNIAMCRVIPVVCMLPVVSLILCVTLTIIEDPLGLSRTHCTIPNYVPSLSASVSVGLRKRVWIASLGITCAIRLFISCAYNKALSNFVKPSNQYLVFLLQAHYWLHLSEITCLFLLTIFTSTENFPFHRNAFALFIISCVLFGLLDLHLLKMLRGTYAQVVRELLLYKSFKVDSIRKKRYLLTTMVFAILLSTSCYLLHNRYCIPHLYSLFALSEHVFILANVAFHYRIIDLIGEMPLNFIGSMIQVSFSFENVNLRNCINR